MSTPESRSWGDAVDALRRAANEVRAAVGQDGSPGAEEDAAANRLKSDVSRLETAATELLGNLSANLGERRSELGSAADRERAEVSAEQIKHSLEQLATLAASLTSDVAAAAGKSLKQAEPELKSAARALEDVTVSAAAWVRTVIDPKTADRGGSADPSGNKPLDDL